VPTAPSFFGLLCTMKNLHSIHDAARTLSEQSTRKEYGIIDAILEYGEQQKSEIRQHVEEQKILLNAENFFTDTDPNGITSKGVFLNYAISVGKRGLLAFQQFLSDIGQKVKLEIPMFTTTDKDGNQYYWITQRGKTTTRGYKLMHFDGLDRLIAAYQFDMYRFELTLEELFEEAKKA